MARKRDLRARGVGATDSVGEHLADRALDLVGLHPFELAVQDGDVLPAPHEDELGRDLGSSGAGDSVYYVDEPSSVTLGSPAVRPGRFDGQRLRLSTLGSNLVLVAGSVRGAGADVVVLPGADRTLLWDAARRVWSLEGDVGAASTTAAPVNVDASAAVVGTSTAPSKADHKHDVTEGLPVSLALGGSNTLGTGPALALANHAHRIDNNSFEVFAVNLVQTTSPSPLVVLSVVVSDLVPPGTFLVWTNGQIGTSGGPATAAIDIAVDGVGIDRTRRDFVGAGGGIGAPLSNQVRTAVAVGESLQFRIVRLTGNGTVEIQRRSIMVLRVDD